MSDVNYMENLVDGMNCVKQEDLDGSAVVNFIMNRIYEDMNLEYTHREGCESIFNRFSKEMF